MRRIAPLLVLPCVLLLWAAAALAAPSFPALTGRIVDDANIIPPAMEAELDAKLAAQEASTGDQFVVVTLSSLQGYDIADYGYQLGRHWGIGQAGRDNGVLLIVAPNEREVRIEVGYGLEGTLTDALSRIIIDNAILPRFRNGDMAGGISAGADDVLKVLAGQGDEVRKLAQEQQQADELRSTLVLIAFWVVVFIIIINISRHGGGPIIMGGPGWSSGRRGGFGGGFSRGGGFSGGGGSFGGGGASGRW